MDYKYIKFCCANVYKILFSCMLFVVMSNLSSSNMHFEPDNGLMKITKYVSCPAGFGIREVFCAACPPHYFSPDKTSDCQKCHKGFHQPVAGSENCVKCPSIFSSGCQMVSTRMRSNLLQSTEIKILTYLQITFTDTQLLYLFDLG